MVEKVKNVGYELKQTAIKYGPAAMAFTMIVTQSLNNYVMAGGGGDAKGLAQKILEIVAKLIIALGIFIAVLGIVNFASSHAEGNGGAQDKAVKQIAAGVMVVALSALLLSQAGELASYITTT